VKKSMAQAMGWTDKAVVVSDMLAAAREGKLRFSMTSATQSNSGSSAYLGFLHALAGSPDVLRMEHLSNPQIQSDLKELLSKINRSSGSSGWLKTSIVEHPERFQAMINYESMIIEANRELMAKGQEPLYAIYPADGIMIADSPLGYVDKGDPRKKEIFAKLQQYLLSDEVQQKILAMGRRTGLVGLNPDSADKRVFNPDWGIDIAKIISPIPTPSEEVIRKALELYQVSLRKPSCTAYVVDVSGSMEGKGIEELKAAMTTLLDPAQAARYLLQPSAEDVHIIVPFNSQPLNGVMVSGNGVETMNNLLNFVQSLAPGGGTDIYSAAARAIDVVSNVPNIDKYFPAIILMTDGQSKGEIGMLKQAMDRTPLGHDIPIHSITFGDASETQLKEISEISIGRVFQGQDLIKAFRQAKGYN
jgi:Ca-activated chloride channel homolog